MVEYTYNLDDVFSALADNTRRDILEQVAQAEMTIGEIAAAYKLTFAAVSKHIKVLEKARLIVKRRRGRERVVQVVPDSLAVAQEQIEQYRMLWETRFDRLEMLLKEEA